MEQTKSGLTPEQGDILVRLARLTIAERFAKEGVLGKNTLTKDDLADRAFQDSRGVFVTLKKKGQLRGCIGSLKTTESILEGVKRNAINAAFQDPRFAPLGKKEQDEIEIEVSILTSPVPLPYKDCSDLVASLRRGIDGVILRKGYASATFLPQVWEQLPDPKLFLSHLCLKAGLPVNAWQQGGLEIEIYQVQYFHEK